MSASGPNQPKRPELPEPAECYTESIDSVYLYDDSPGDNTVRPAPPNIPIGWYPRVERPLKRPPEAETPKDQNGPPTGS